MLTLCLMQDFEKCVLLPVIGGTLTTKGYSQARHDPGVCCL